jgi:hypothetical protein
VITVVSLKFVTCLVVSDVIICVYIYIYIYIYIYVAQCCINLLLVSSGYSLHYRPTMFSEKLVTFLVVAFTHDNTLSCLEFSGIE